MVVCPKCKSNNISFQAAVTEKQRARHSLLYWVFIGWWLHPLLWIFLTLPMLVWRLIAPNRKTQSVTVTNAVCQYCSYTWQRQ
jgi:hypothetical protein